jgi:hypothetical protein
VTIDGSSLSAWLTAASFLNAWIWAWRARIRVEFFKKKLILGVGPQQPIPKRYYFLYRRNGIGCSTDTYNHLPTNTKKLFFSSDEL